MYKISEFSKLCGMSIRMLRHYDEIGLLVPYSTTNKGYRVYDDANLKKAQEILLFKELEFSLSEITEILGSKNYNPNDALHMQKNLLTLKRERLDKIIDFIDELLNNKEISMKDTLNKALDKSVIDNTKLMYAKEAKQRWNTTSEYKQSQERMSSYSQEELEQIQEEQAKIYKDLAQLMSKGIKDEEVQNKVHEVRMFISKYWYECTIDIFSSLGEMYVSDERFTKNINKAAGAKLSPFLSEAIAYYCDQNR